MKKGEKLYIFVEGNDDERFFKAVIAPLMKEKYNFVEILKFAQWKKEKTNLFLQSIATLNFDYIFTADYDFSDTVNDKKRYLKYRYTNVEYQKIVVVIKEIESWYYAGLSDDAARIRNLQIMDTTDELMKEEFNTLYHNKFKSRIDFMQELLKLFDTETARQKNKSFDFFCENFVF